MSHSPSTDRKDDVAIIGMSLRFPGASSVDEFWENLRNGVESTSFFTDVELAEAGIPPAMLARPNFVKALPSIDQIEYFDAAFFGFKPREAEAMDPQLRVFLECSWWALEHAGYDPERYSGRVSVYAGESISNYFMFHVLPVLNTVSSEGSLFGTVSYNDKDALATVVSHKLNLRGPSVSVQTFCSTSLVAVHLACQSLLSGESDMALAGGSSISSQRVAGYFFEEGGITSPDGHNRAFDAKGKGTVFGNGTGVVVLKRLADALAHRDVIYAVIKGTAINNDGAHKAGYTAPSVDGQAEAITIALQRADVDPATIHYVEAHGTATQIGDPIEVQAMTKAFRAWTDKKQYCPIGSVKTNFGHLDRAAGVAGLIKTALIVKSGEIPPSLHYESPNPKIDFENSPFYVNARLSPFPSADGPRRAGVSSLGIGGTNAHAILEQPPSPTPGSPGRPSQVVLLSARSDAALGRAGQQLVKYLGQHPDANLADMAYTLSVGRRGFQHRLAVVGSDVTEVLSALETRNSQKVWSGAPRATARPTVFLFPGQGSQYVGMGRGLYDHEPTFHDDVDRASERLKALTGWDLREILYPSAERRAEADARLRETEVTQPALFVIELALARLWMRWGIRPVGMLGHSVGEYVAACLAGVFADDDALALVAARGALMQSLPPGAMLAVPLAEADALRYAGDRVSLAAVNGPQSCVLSGDFAAIEQVEAALSADGIGGRRLATSHAFHSAMMEPILDEFRRRVAAVSRSAPQVPCISNLTGTWITTREATNPDYWVQHLRQAVRFASGVAALMDNPDRVPLEVGPGRTLGQLARQQPSVVASAAPCQSLRAANETRPDMESVVATAGHLWTQGVDVDWPAFWQGEARNRVALPTYPFERQRYWLEAHGRADAGSTRVAAAPTRPALADWFYLPTWKRSSMPAAFTPQEGRSGEPGWLVLVDESPLAMATVRQLQAAGAAVVSVGVGDGFAQLHETYFSLSPARREDWDALFARLEGTAGLPARIVDFWSLVSPSQPVASLDHLSTAQTRGFQSLLAMTQALGERTLPHPIHIAVVTNQLHNVTGEEVLAPERATLLGPCRVIPQEYPDLTAANIDVTIPEPGSQDERQLVDLLMAESAAQSKDRLVAYRGGYRWAPTYERVHLDEVRRDQLRVRDGGVYLITGGTGGIGLALAEYLAAEHQAKLVLVQRTPLPAEDRWQEWLATHAEDDRASKRIRKVLELREKGAEVVVAAADVGDLAQMRAVVEASEARFGQIHGVLHAAGLPGDGIMQLKEAQVAERVLAPKVSGTLVLEQVFSDKPLDFLALFSSLASLAGGFGQVDYCAANSFLDVFANARDGRARWPVMAINWDAWDEVGMAVETVSRGAAGVLAAADGEPIEHPYFDRHRVSATDEELTGVFTASRVWFLNEHRLFQQPTLPSTGYLEIAASVFRSRVPAGSPFELRDVFFLSPFSVPIDGERELSLLITKQDDESSFEFRSRGWSGEPWQTHCHGRMTPAAEETARLFDVRELEAECQQHEITGTDIAWDAIANKVFDIAAHLSLGSRWANLRRLLIGDRRELTSQTLHEPLWGDVDTTTLHPALLDFTGIMPLPINGTYIPFSFGCVRVFAALPHTIRTYVINHDDLLEGKDTVAFDAFLMDADGRALVEVERMTLRRIDQGRKTAASQAPMAASAQMPVGQVVESRGSAAASAVAELEAAPNLRLLMPAPGLFSNLELRPVAREDPEHGQIEIEVVAAGLNFKDVLRALGMIPAEAGGDVAAGFGPECAGRVVRVGAGVEGFQPGDEVMAIAPGSMGRYTRTLAALAVPIPRGLTFEQAATIPLVFLTAYHSLVTQGRLRKGERVLIHAAAGGVGLAALQIARHIGAEIYATASAPKRDYLKALGVPHVADSRSLSFVDDIRAATNGEGVDVVLNSLSGEFIAASLGLLRPYGRFIEIGARDIYQNTLMGLRPFANNLTYSAVDLGPLCFHHPEQVREMFLTVAEHFTSGAYRALPLEAVPMTEAERAFERMATGQHVGKIVLLMQATERGATAGAPGRGSRVGLAAQRDSAELIAPHEGVDAFRRILGHRHVQVVVSPKNLLAVLEGATASRAAGLDAPMPSHVRVQHPRPDLATPFVMPRNDAERKIAEIWQDLLGITEVGVNDSFFELGGDSLIGVQVLSRIKKAFGIQLPSSILYEGPTVESLTRLVTAGEEVGAGASFTQARSRAERRRERQQRKQDEA